MANFPESSTTTCDHCDRAIPTPNFELHYAHCVRNLERCSICGDMVPKRHAEEHYASTHAPVACSLCSEKVERDVLTLHKDEKCPQRIVICEYCEFPLPAVDLLKHQELCGNRTEYCENCRKYVRLRERSSHEIQCCSASNGLDTDAAESSREGRVPAREQGARRGQGQDASKRRLIVTIAITGIAVVIGSFILQRRNQNQPPQ
ncbi:uncharacterized protein LOC116249709 [Nymphaea colorata]|nr:uncharacterized protein LOC116249709 [Nymphaea colorata]